jgi:ABC-type metal ion transport system substrate-binding protein
MIKFSSGERTDDVVHMHIHRVTVKHGDVWTNKVKARLPTKGIKVTQVKVSIYKNLGTALKNSIKETT